MTGKTLLQLRTEVLGRLPTPSALIPSATLDRFINLGEADVATKALCLESIVAAVTAANVRTVSTPYIKVLAVEYLAGGTVKPVGLPKMQPVQMGHTLIPGKITPQKWFPWGKTICIDPKPTAVYNLNLYVASLPSARMVNDGDYSQIPVKLQDKVVAFAYIRCLMRLGQYGTAATEYGKYVRDLATIRNATIEKFTQTVADTRTADRVLARA